VKRQHSMLLVVPSSVGDMAWLVNLAFRRLGWATKTFDNRAYIRRGLGGSSGSALSRLEHVADPAGGSSHLRYFFKSWRAESTWC
jgi:hypothetical protein